MNKKQIAGLLLLPALLSSPLFADEITDQINEGLKAYETKDYKGAVDELKFATAQLEKLAYEENKKLLPDAIDGWEKQKIKNSNNQMAMSIMGGGTSIKGRYKKDKEQVDIEVVANSPLLAMISMMLKNPAMISADDSMEPYRYKRIKGVKKTKGNRVEITLLIAGQIMLKVEGRNLKDKAVLKQYLDAIDINKLKEKLL
ncbi:MAG: hypothetical protein DSZ29_04855 [Aquificaceae bacterium]|nr:MAG: hypothetical protein DSZ29_04855 [Aquificaceae bacterium]